MTISRSNRCTVRFLIDAQGRVLWQEHQLRTLQDDEFLLKEAGRLLNVPES